MTTGPAPEIRAAQRLLAPARALEAGLKPWRFRPGQAVTEPPTTSAALRKASTAAGTPQ